MSSDPTSEENDPTAPGSSDPGNAGTHGERTTTLERAIAAATRIVVGSHQSGRGRWRSADSDTRRRAVLTLIVCYAGIAFAAVFAPMALLQGKGLLGGLEIGFAAILLGVAAYIRVAGYHIALEYVGGISAGAMFAYLMMSGGGGDSGHIWSLTFPLFALFILGASRGAVASLLLMTTIVALFVFENRLPIESRHPWAFKARFLAGYGLILAFAYFFERTRAKGQGQLAARNLDLKHKVAELRLTDQARRESETLLKATLESTGAGILVISTDGRVVTSNDRFAEMWRLPPEFVESTTGAELVARVRDELADPDTFAAGVEQLYRAERESAIDTLHFKDGRVFERRSAPLVVDAEVKGRVWSFRDISERVRAGEEKARLQAALQRSQKMEALGTLAGGVAHDLNNVLAGIVGYPDVLINELPDGSPLKEDLEVIRASGTKAALIVQDLLTLARRGVPSRSVLNLNTLVETYRKSPEHRGLLASHPNVVVEVELADDLLNVMGSPIHLGKTVMNLVSNAAEAMPEGGKLRICTCNRYVDEPVLGYDSVEEGEYVLLSVSDTGVGIAQDRLEHIFEPFYTSKQMGRSGSGLGLAVIWSTVKDLKGYIDVRSTEGEGTVFTLYFPATRAEIDTEPAPSMQSIRGNGESILVVDDVPEQRDIATRALTALGYSVMSVPSGEAAIEYLKEHQADLLVLDMIMPGLDGLDTYQRILELHPKQRAIIASGYSETERVREAQKLGAGAYLRKPFVTQTIGLAVKQALRAP